MLPPPELDGRVERCLIDLSARQAEPVDAQAVVAAILADAASHTADALPELLILARGGFHFETRLRPYLGEVVHCLASALEAALLASREAADGLGITGAGDGEPALAAAVLAYLGDPQ